jgi:hypothetical protein
MSREYLAGLAIGGVSMLIFAIAGLRHVDFGGRVFLAILVWALVMVGSWVRNRPVDEVDSPPEP